MLIKLLNFKYGSFTQIKNKKKHLKTKKERNAAIACHQNAKEEVNLYYSGCSELLEEMNVKRMASYFLSSISYTLIFLRKG
jgi:hypothetical protein